MLQRTIAKSVEIVGIGLHKGTPVKMKLSPLGANEGIVFYRKDLGKSIELKSANITDTTLATTIGIGEASVSTIEHFCSALFAYGIDNLLVEIDNNEVPIMDGSSIGFCMLLEEGGIQKLDAFKKVILIKEKVEVIEGKKRASFSPADTLSFDFTIEFDHPVIRKQEFSFDFSTENYKKEIARARTFGFLHEVQYLRSKGLALGGSLANAIVLDNTKILNQEGLRYKNEFVRHKILDAIGDVSLANMPILGKYTSYAGSHALNQTLVKTLLASNAYEIITLSKELSKELNLYEGIYAAQKCRTPSA